MRFYVFVALWLVYTALIWLLGWRPDAFFWWGVLVAAIIGFAIGLARAVARDVRAWNAEVDKIMNAAFENFPNDILHMRASFWKREILLGIGIEVGSAAWNASRS